LPLELGFRLLELVADHVDRVGGEAGLPAGVFEEPVMPS
jgi:hypothetical protein